MKAFFYTLILCVILIGAVVFLRHTEMRQEPAAPQPAGEPVASGPPLPLSSADLNDFESYALEELYSTGVEFMEQWHVPEALAVFDEVIKQDSSYIDAYIKIAECCADPLLFREKRVVESLAGAIGLTANDTILVSALRDLFLRADYEMAVEKLNRVDVRGDAALNLDLLRATALYRSGDYAGARAVLAKVLDQDASHGRGRELLIRCYAAEGDLVEAEALAKDLASLYTGEPHPYVLLALIEQALGKHEQAVDFCNNALNLDPGYFHAILVRGYLYLVDGNAEAARVSFEKLLLYDDPILSSAAQEAIATVHFFTGNFGLAVEEMDDAIRLASQSGSQRRALHLAYRLVEYVCELGQGDAAEEILDRWLSGSGDIPYALARLRLDLFHGKLDNAAHVLEWIPGKREWLLWMRVLGASYHELEALIHLKGNGFDRALTVLQGGGERGSGESYFSGFAAFELGRAEDAAAHFERVLRQQITPDYPYHGDPVRTVQALFYLGEANLARGDSEQAIDYYNRLISWWGDSDWDLQAVTRAREKLSTLSPSQSAE